LYAVTVTLHVSDVNNYSLGLMKTLEQDSKLMSTPMQRWTFVDRFVLVHFVELHKNLRS